MRRFKLRSAHLKRENPANKGCTIPVISVEKIFVNVTKSVLQLEKPKDFIFDAAKVK